MRRPLETLLAAIARRDSAARLYFCGDYCDRGPDSRGVVDLLLTLAGATFVRGNHDDVMDLCCSGKSFGTGPGLGGDVDEQTAREVKELFLREGLMETLVSYGADQAELGRRAGDGPAVLAWIDQAIAQVPAAHKKFYRQLPAVAEADDFFVCHATWPADQLDEPGRMNGIAAGDPYLRHDVLWGRYSASQLKSKKAWRRTGYFGHTPTDNYRDHPALFAAKGGPAFGEKVVLLDTAAFAPGGWLTAVCHDDGAVLQAHRSGELMG